MTPMTPTKTAAQPPAKSSWDGPAKAKALRRSVRPSAEMGIDGELRGAMMATRTQPMGAMRVPSPRAGRAAKQMSTAARDAKPFVVIRAPTEQKHATMVSMRTVFQRAEMGSDASLTRARDVLLLQRLIFTNQWPVYSIFAATGL